MLAAEDTCKEGGAVVRQAHFIAVVGAFLIGCAVLLMVGFSGVRAEASQEDQGHTEDNYLWTVESVGSNPTRST
jgi:hypothetical protein